MTEINLEKEIDNYNKAKDAIGEFFDVGIDRGIVFELDTKWTDYSEKHGSIGFCLENDEFQYSFTVYGTSRWERDGYVLFVGNNCWSEKEMYIFKLENKDEE